MELFEAMRRVNQAFGTPCLVHAVKGYSAFKRILDTGVLAPPRTPGDESGGIHEFLGVGGCTFLSVGFQYNLPLVHSWPYGMIFDLSLLEKYRISAFRTWVVWEAFREYLHHLSETDDEELLRLRDLGSKHALIIDAAFNSTPRVGTYFTFWKIEQELFNSLYEHPDRLRISERIRRRLDHERVPQDELRGFCTAEFDEPSRSELVCHEPISLEEAPLIGVIGRDRGELQALLQESNLRGEQVGAGSSSTAPPEHPVQNLRCIDLCDGETAVTIL